MDQDKIYCEKTRIGKLREIYKDNSMIYKFYLWLNKKNKRVGAKTINRLTDTHRSSK